jgi:hypothetical protein
VVKCRLCRNGRKWDSCTISLLWMYVRSEDRSSRWDISSNVLPLLTAVNRTLNTAQGFGSVDNELKTHIPHRVGISRAYHGLSGDRVVTASGVKTSTLSLGLPIATSAGIGIEFQVRYDTANSFMFDMFHNFVQASDGGWLIIKSLFMHGRAMLSG